MNFPSFFLIFFFFLHVYVNVLSVLGAPTSRNTEILSRIYTLNYRIPTHMGSKVRFNLYRETVFFSKQLRINCTSEQIGLFSNFHEWRSHEWKLEKVRFGINCSAVNQSDASIYGSSIISGQILLFQTSTKLQSSSSVLCLIPYFGVKLRC